MGPINWLAVFLAAALAVAIGLVWNGPMFRTGRPIIGGGTQRRGNVALVLVVMLMASAMLGHALARIGAETLAAKPWLYWMQSGGLAAFFVCPAVWLTNARNAVEPLRRVLDAAFWLVAYLAMGTVFWIFG